MSVSGLAPKRFEDVAGISHASESFAFTAPEPLWAPLAGDRPRAAARLFAFVAAAGIGSGLALWMAGEFVAAAVRSMF